MSQLLVALITALGTGASIWFGSYLTRGNEDRKWRRDRCLEAYSEVLRAVESVRFEADATYFGADCGTEEHAKQHEIVLEKVAEMYRTEQRVRLVAPDEVNARLGALTHHVGTEIGAKLSKCPKIDEGGRKSATEKFAELLVRFNNEARNDLGIHPPLHTFEEWETTLTTTKSWWRGIRQAQAAIAANVAKLPKLLGRKD
jgi:hypothetical protein